MMRAMRLPLLVLGISALLLASGCKSLVCNNPEDYARAQEVQPLKMPVGLDGPDTSQALKIPALNEPEVPRDPHGPCLEDPPVFVPAATTPGSPVPASTGPSSEARTRKQQPSRPPNPHGGALL